MVCERIAVLMSIEAVRAFFRAKGMEQRILEFDSSSATVELAAEAAGCEPARIAKSLTFMTDSGPIMIVAAGDARIDNPAFKARFRCKARMLTPEEVIRYTGHEIGGVCPFAVGEGVSIYLDVSLRRFETVYPACGSGNSAIELTNEELEALSGGTWIDVCKSWRD